MSKKDVSTPPRPDSITHWAWEKKFETLAKSPYFPGFLTLAACHKKGASKSFILAGLHLDADSAASGRATKGIRDPNANAAWYWFDCQTSTLRVCEKKLGLRFQKSIFGQMQKDLFKNLSYPLEWLSPLGPGVPRRTFEGWRKKPFPLWKLCRIGAWHWGPEIGGLNEKDENPSTITAITLKFLELIEDETLRNAAALAIQNPRGFRPLLEKPALLMISKEYLAPQRTMMIWAKNRKALELHLQEKYGKVPVIATYSEAISILDPRSEYTLSSHRPPTYSLAKDAKKWPKTRIPT